MDNIQQLISDSELMFIDLQRLFVLFTILAVIMVIILIVSILNRVSIARLQMKYDSFFNEKSDTGESVIQLLDSYIDETRRVGAKYNALDSRTASLEAQVPLCFQKVGMVRYNPFEDTGGDLSYAIALLDKNNNGFVLNGIFNRSGSYTYAKEIEGGACVKYKLSAEELEALQIALSK